MKNLIILTTIFVLSVVAFPQNLKDDISTIILDKKDVRLFTTAVSIEFTATELKNINIIDTDYEYKVIMLLSEKAEITKKIELPSDLIQVFELHGTLKSSVTASKSPNKVVLFSDIYALPDEQKNTFNNLLLSKLKTVGQVDPIGISSSGTSKIISKYNYDYLEDKKRLSGHLYDFDNPKTVKLDFSPSRLTLYLKDLYQNTFGAEEKKHFAVGFEVTTQEKLLNVLPFQNTALYTGLRMLPLGLKVDENAGVDIILYWKKALDISSTIMNKRFYGLFYGASEVRPKLNSTDGFAVDVSYFNDPIFLNLWVSISKKDFYNPISSTDIVGWGDKYKEGYFSFAQAQFTHSFYWNFDKTHFIKLDLGLGSHDVWGALYLRDEKQQFQPATQKTKFMGGGNVQPIVGFEYDLVLRKSNSSLKNELFGASLKYYDYRVKLLSWLKLWDNKDLSFISRLETMYVTDKISGARFAWDDKGGYAFQLRFMMSF